MGAALADIRQRRRHDGGGLRRDRRCPVLSGLVHPLGVIMCGRIRQARDDQYMETLHWAPRELSLEDRLRYNVPPGTRPLVLHRLGDGGEHVDRLFWGYRPPWYKRGPASNARLDTVLKGSPFWRPLLSRRVIVPADGWYEWTGV